MKNKNPVKGAPQYCECCDRDANTCPIFQKYMDLTQSIEDMDIDSDLFEVSVNCMNRVKKSLTTNEWKKYKNKG